VKLWLVPVLVVLAAGAGAAAAAWLPPVWAFLAIASCLVIGLGAAPVVFSVYTRRRDLREWEQSRASSEAAEHKMLR
jgi:hypothetical protein